MQEHSGSDAGTTAIAVAAVVVVVAFELVEAVLFVLFAQRARRGVAWARIGLLVLTALAVLGFAEGALVLGLLRLALAITGTVLLFLRPVDRAFSP